MNIFKILKRSKFLSRIRGIFERFKIAPLIRKNKTRFLRPFYPILRKFKLIFDRILGKDPQFLLPFIYAGNNVICLCCGWKGEKFLKYLSRNNSKCPNCGSVERSRLIYLYLQLKFNFFNLHLKILDIGPDIHFQDQFCCYDNFDYLSVDLCNPRLMMCMDITKMTFSNDFFDVVLCSNVLEHIKDDKMAMSEIYRVLKPDGFAIILVPIGGEKTFKDPTIPVSEYEKYYGCSDHVRLYGLDIKDKLVSTGFNVKIDYFAKEISPANLKRYGIDPKEIIFLCTK